MVDSGETEMTGSFPVNPSGGVLSTNPIGASGMLRFAEAALQVRGLAGEHQVDGARRRWLRPTAARPSTSPWRSSARSRADELTMSFGFATTADEVLAGVDLGGQLILVTGASSGLGWETARALAGAGADVVLAVRTEERGEAAVAKLREAVGEAGGHVEYGVVELGSLASVGHFAEWFARRYQGLDVLINNAGVMATPLSRTTEGFELQFGCNHLGHFVLTSLLIPQLLAGDRARVVNLSSGGHRASDIVWEDPNYERRPYDRWEAYGQSKTANILFGVELDHRYGSRGVSAFAVHPGMIATRLGRHLNKDDFAELSARAKGNLPAYKSVEAGAATSVWAATHRGLDGHGGTYLEDCGISENHAPWALDPVSATRLWALSEQLVDRRFDAS